MDPKKIGLKNGFVSENLYVIYNSLNYNEQKTFRENFSFEDIKHIRSKSHFVTIS